MYKRVFLFLSLRDVLTQSAASQGSFRLDVAFAGLFLSRVELSPRCWDLSEVSEPKGLALCSSVAKGGPAYAEATQWRQISSTSASSASCHWKGAQEREKMNLTMLYP